MHRTRGEKRTAGLRLCSAVNREKHQLVADSSQLKAEGSKVKGTTGASSQLIARS
jgi:hypothetical protein